MPVVLGAAATPAPERWTRDAQACLAGTPRFALDVALCRYAAREGVRQGASPASVAALHTARARALSNLAQPGPAIEALDTALALNPVSSEAWRLRGMVLRESGQLTTALENFDRAVSLSPFDAAARRERAYAHLLADNPTLAGEDFERTLALNPYDPQSWTLRGVLHYMNERFPEAEADFARAHRLAYAYDYLPLWRFLALVRMRQRQQAMAVVTEARSEMATPVWPAALFDHFLGTSTHEQALAAAQATGADRHPFEASFYLAELALVRDDGLAAGRLFGHSAGSELRTAERPLARLRLTTMTSR